MSKRMSFPGPEEENLALRPNVRIAVSVSHPTGGGARDPRVLLNETAHRLDGYLPYLRPVRTIVRGCPGCTGRDAAAREDFPGGQTGRDRIAGQVYPEALNTPACFSLLTATLTCDTLVT